MSDSLEWHMKSAKHLNDCVKPDFIMSCTDIYWMKFLIIWKNPVYISGVVQNR